MNCLLCDKENLPVKENISREALAALWKATNVDVREEIKGPVVELYSCGRCGLEFFDPKHAGGNIFYSALGEFEWYYLHPGKTEYDHVQQYIKDGQYILDIGSGRGALFSKISKRVNYTGLELSTKAVELAQQAGIPVRNEDLLLHADVNPEKYDLVCLFQVLEHLTELDSFIAAIKKSLKPGGLFCIAVPNNDGFVSYTSNYTFNLPPHHTILWKESSLRYLAQKYGFHIVEVHKETLQDVHREIAYQSFLVKVFKNLVLKKIKLVDQSKTHLLITRIVSRLMAIGLFRRLAMPLLKLCVKDGQSIIVTLQKPEL